MTTYHGPYNPHPGPGEAGIIIYGYVPSLSLAIPGVITFALALVVNLYYLRKYKGFKTFHTLLVVGSLMECGGYIARIASHSRPYVVGTFVAQYFLIVVAPVLFSAAIYISLSLAVTGFSAQSLLLLRARTVIIIFVTLDVITTIIQVLGAALVGSSESATVSGKKSAVTPDQAGDIVIAGLAFQTFSFLVFFIFLLVALRRATSKTFLASSHDTDAHRPLVRMLLVIVTTAFFILLRTVFRLAEASQGFFGFASTHESLFATLEYLPVILAVAIWTAFPPSKLLGPGYRSSRLQPGTTSEKPARSV